MSDRRRMKLTQDQAFERWWAKKGPPSYMTLTVLEREYIKDWARMASRHGYELGRKRQRERTK